MKENQINSTTTTTKEALKVKKPRGFAAMSPEKRRSISILGAQKAHELGVAYKFSSEKAGEAGKLGGNAHHTSRGREKIVVDVIGKSE